MVGVVKAPIPERDNYFLVRLEGGVFKAITKFMPLVDAQQLHDMFSFAMTETGGAWKAEMIRLWEKYRL